MRSGFRRTWDRANQPGYAGRARSHKSVIVPGTGHLHKPSLDIPPEWISAQAFVASVYELVGRPFKDKKHLAPAKNQQHLGFVNDFSDFSGGIPRLKPKDGKLEDIYNKLMAIRLREQGSILG